MQDQQSNQNNLFQITQQSSPKPNFDKLQNRKDFSSPIQLVSKSCHRNLRSSAFNQAQTLNVPHGTFSSSRSNNSSNKSSNRNSCEQDLMVKYTKSFKNIVQRQNQDSDYDCQQRCFEQLNDQQEELDMKEQKYQINENSYSPENMDILGNLLPICEFDLQEKQSSERQDEQSYFTRLPEIIQDKENQIPFGSNIKSNSKNMSLYTPLKNKNQSLRSPLRDITPSMTKTKKRSAAQNRTNATQRSFLFTPRNQPLTQSRISGSGLRRMQRF